MSLGLVRVGLTCLAAMIAGQNRSYRVELSDGTTGRVMVVNESDEPMEAFHFQEDCGASHSHFSFSQDRLDFWGWGGHLAGLDGRFVGSPYLLEPYPRGVPRHIAPKRPVACIERAEVDAVLYADGSYAGDDLALRGLQARRDGIAASVQNWAAKMESRGSLDPKIKDLGTEADSITEADLGRSASGCQSEPLSCQYWSGRAQADVNIALAFKVPKDQDDADVSRRVLAVISSWQKKIDEDVAFQKLEATFPLPAGIAPGPGRETAVK